MMMTQTLDAQELANSLSSDYLNIQKYLPRTQTPQMQPGIYLGSNGVHYAFRKTRAGKVWPHIMTKVEGEKATFTFSATGFKVCKAENRLTVEECETLSLHLGYCILCGKELTVKKSVAMGMGPVCRKKY